MTERNMKLALEEAKKVVGMIEADALTDAQKEAMIKESIANFNENVNPGWLEYRKSVSTDSAFVEWEDEGEVFKDVYGTEFIDCLGGFGIYACGHGNPEIKKTVRAQLDRYCLHSQELVDPLRGYLARLLALITPGDLQYSFFTNGGAEAIEMALKLARLATGGKWYISTVGAFHGKSMGAISMGGKGAYREDYIPMIQQVQHVERNGSGIEKAEIDPERNYQHPAQCQRRTGKGMFPLAFAQHLPVDEGKHAPLHDADQVHQQLHLQLIAHRQTALSTPDKRPGWLHSRSG